MAVDLLVREEQPQFIPCSFCKKVLSVGPVYSNGSKDVCGRCNINVVTKGNAAEYMRQFAYEMFATTVMFPCTFADKGCNEKAKWNENHEQTCKQRPLRCPLSYKEKFNLPVKCKWYNHGGLINQHIEESHKDYVLHVPTFTLTSSSKIFFTPVGNHLFTIVFLYTAPNKYIVSVMACGTAQEIEPFRYQLELYSTDKHSSVVLRQTGVDLLHNMQNIPKNANLIEINEATVEDLVVDFNNLCGKVSIVRKIKREADLRIAESSGNKLLKKEQYDERLLCELECPVCKDYMIPPIYICTAGHSICSLCKRKVSSCPTCRSNLQDTRNFTLENLTTRVNYPCRNKHMGCQFVTTSDKIKAHENACNLTGNQCILKCHWRGTKADMVAHLEKDHEKNILRTGTTYIQDMQAVITDPYYAVIHNGEIYRFALKNYVGQGILKFNLQHSSPEATTSLYKYKMEFIDENKLGVELNMVYLCQNLTPKPKDAFNNCITVTKEALNPFLKNNLLCYKFSIDRI